MWSEAHEAHEFKAGKIVMNVIEDHNLPRWLSFHWVYPAADTPAVKAARPFVGVVAEGRLGISACRN